MWEKANQRISEGIVLFVILSLVISPAVLGIEEIEKIEAKQKEEILKGGFGRISIIEAESYYKKSEKIDLFGVIEEQVKDPVTLSDYIELCFDNHTDGGAKDCVGERQLYFPDNTVDIKLNSVWCDDDGEVRIYYWNGYQWSDPPELVHSCDAGLETPPGIPGSNTPEIPGPEVISIYGYWESTPGPFMKIKGKSLEDAGDYSGVWVNITRTVFDEVCDQLCEQDYNRYDPDCPQYTGKNLCGDGFDFEWIVSSAPEAVLENQRTLALTQVSEMKSEYPSDFVDPVTISVAGNTLRKNYKINASEDDFYLLYNLSFYVNALGGNIDASKCYYKVCWDVFINTTNGWSQSKYSECINPGGWSSFNVNNINQEANRVFIRFYERYKTKSGNSCSNYQGTYYNVATTPPDLDAPEFARVRIINSSWKYHYGSYEEYRESETNFKSLSPQAVGEFSLSAAARTPFKVASTAGAVYAYFEGTGDTDYSDYQTGYSHDVMACINRKDSENLVCDAGELAWYNQTLCTNTYGISAWRDSSEMTDPDGTKNYCCGDQDSDCGDIKKKGASNYICNIDSSTGYGQWINTYVGAQEAIGVIKHLSCQDIDYTYENQGKILVCSDGELGSIYDADDITVEGMEFGFTDIRAAKDNTLRNYLCYRDPDDNRVKMIVCDGPNVQGRQNSKNIGSNVTFNGTNYVCNDNKQFVPLSRNIGQSACINLGIWTGNYCCIPELGETYYDNGTIYDSGKGCWRGNVYSTTQGVAGTDDRVLYANGSFYGCEYDYLSLQDYEYLHDYEELDFNLQLSDKSKEYKLSYTNGTKKYLIKFTKYDSAPTNLGGTKITLNGREVNQIIGGGMKKWRWRAIGDRSFIVEISTPSNNPRPDDMIRYYLDRDNQIRLNPLENNTKLPIILDGQARDIISAIDGEVVDRIDNDKYNVGLCENIEKYFCLPNNGWKSRPVNPPYTNINILYTNLSEVIWQPGLGETQQGCCASGDCWKGDQCVLNQAGQSSIQGLYGDNQYACIDGEWNETSNKTDWNGQKYGSCDDETDCFIAKDSVDKHYDIIPTDGGICVPNATWVEDHICLEGKWSSRTRLVAKKLISFVGATENYTLFCDNYTNTLNYFNHTIGIGDPIDAKYLTGIPDGSVTGQCESDMIDIERPGLFGDITYIGLMNNPNCVNNLCVLRKNPGKNNEEVYFGTSQNKYPFNSLSDFLAGSLYTDNLVTEANLLIFRYEYAQTSQGQINILDIFRNIINFFREQVFGQERVAGVTIDENFERLYIAKQGQKKIHVVNTYDLRTNKNVLTGEYECFEKDPCPSIKQLSTADKKGLSCNHSNYRASIFNQKDLGARGDIDTIGNDLWLGVTAKLRIDDTENTINDKPTGTLSSDTDYGLINHNFDVNFYLTTTSCDGVESAELSVQGATPIEQLSESEEHPGLYTAKYRFTTSGRHTATATITDTDGHTATTGKTITAFGLPSANLVKVTDGTVFNLGEEINFTYTCSSSDPGSYSKLTNCSLDLDNGTIIELPNCAGERECAGIKRIRYQQGRSYVLKLTATENHGYNKTQTLSPAILVNSPPIANIVADRDNILIKKVVNLDGRSSSPGLNDQADSIIAAKWRVVSTNPTGLSYSFGTAHQQRTTFTPNDIGTYNISLVVNDSHGVQSPPAYNQITATNPKPIITCGATKATTILKLSDTDNAHVGIGAGSSYTTLIKCGVDRGTLSRGTGLAIASISGPTNAHISNNTSYYPENVIRLSYAEADGIDRGHTLNVYSKQSSCNSGDVCLFRISSRDNAHAGTCADSSYPIRICLGFN